MLLTSSLVPNSALKFLAYKFNKANFFQIQVKFVALVTMS